MIPSLMSVKDLAITLGIAEDTIRHWVSERRIPFVKVGRRTLFDPREIGRWIEANTVRERGELPGLDRVLGKRSKRDMGKDKARVEGR